MPQEAEEPEPELEAMVAAAARVTAVLERELHPPVKSGKWLSRGGNTAGSVTGYERG